jgi:hypothetical protein
MLALLGAAPTASVEAAPEHHPTAFAAHRCSPGYTHADLSWGHKCLRAGQYCKKGRTASTTATASIASAAGA